MINQMSNIIRYDLQGYYRRYVDFVETLYPDIVRFYSGEMDTPNSVAFTKLDDLLKEAAIIDGIIYTNRRAVTINAESWVVIDEIETMRNKLLTMKNSGKWMRSSISLAGHVHSTEALVGFGQNQTLESLSVDLGNDAESWTDLAILNDLKEEDYTIDGGLSLKTYRRAGVSNIPVMDVIDAMDGIKFFGKDINKHIEFVSDDIYTLEYEDTLRQSYEILINMRRGDVPEFLDLGIKNLAGVNIVMTSFPVISRQIKQTMLSDDMTINTIVTEVNREKDMITMTVLIKTKAGMDIIKKLF